MLLKSLNQLNFNIGAMKSLVDNQVTSIQLVKPDIAKKYYELSADGNIFASIDLIRGYGSLARIEVPQGSFTIKRLGFFMPYITLRKEKSDADFAKIYLDLNSKCIFKIDNVTCNFKLLNSWKNQWGWVNENNKPIVKYMLTTFGQVRGDVEFSKDFLYIVHLELLAAVGAYFLLQLEDEVNQNVK